MNRLFAGALGVALVALNACLPRDNPFDRDHVEDAYSVKVAAPEGALTVTFDGLGGSGLLGYRVYREDVAGNRALVAELDKDARLLVDEGAVDAALAAQEALGDGTLWWRVAGRISSGEGPLSTKTDQASTRALPDTGIDPPLPDYISGQAGIAVLVQVIPSTVSGRRARLFRYRFKGGDWTDPILAGPLVLTGLPDGRYTLEVSSVDDEGNVDLTPALARFSYDFHVPEGTSCDPAVCNAGLACVEEPVGKFCRTLCGGDGGPMCASGLSCRLGSGVDGMGACVVVGGNLEGCNDRLCMDGLTCAQLGDARALCGNGCGGGCGNGTQCTGEFNTACLPVVGVGQPCANAACATGLACENRPDNPVCRRICQDNIECGAAQVCTPLQRGDLKICR